MCGVGIGERDERVGVGRVERKGGVQGRDVAHGERGGELAGRGASYSGGRASELGREQRGGGVLAKKVESDAVDRGRGVDNTSPARAGERGVWRSMDVRAGLGLGQRCEGRADVAVESEERRREENNVEMCGGDVKRVGDWRRCQRDRVLELDERRGLSMIRGREESDAGARVDDSDRRDSKVEEDCIGRVGVV